MVECGGLENRYLERSGSRVRIPPSPPGFLKDFMALLIEVKVIPSSGRQAWKLEHGRLKCYLKSPPEKGKANNELLLLIATILRLPSSKISLVSGATSRNKKIKIDAAMTFDTLLKALGIEKQGSLFEH